jgi:hypothetical protein
MVHGRGDNQVQRPVKQPEKRQDISYVTWSARGIRVVYGGAMVVHLTAEDMYPLAVQAKVVSLVASERQSTILGAA